MQPFSDEEAIQKRGFPEADTDAELMDIAKKLTNNWEEHVGYHVEFRTYNFNNYICNDKLQLLTTAEFRRLNQIQKVENERYDSLYNWNNFKDRPLSEDVIIRFFDRYLEKIEKAYGKDSPEYLNAKQTNENKLNQWKDGQVIDVDSISGEYLEKTLYSNGSIKETIWKSE